MSAWIGIRQKLGLAASEDRAVAVRRMLQELLSIEGVRYGTSFGWLVRAKASDSCRLALQQFLADKARIGQLFAFVAVALSHGGAAAGVAPDILGGAHFVTSETANYEISVETRSQLTRIVAASPEQTVQVLEDILNSYSPQLLSNLSSAKRWSSAVGNAYCQVTERGSGISCGRSYMVLPANIVSQLMGSNENVMCPFCRRIIVPIKKASEESRKIGTWYESVLAASQ
jgi:hypothetical protein